MSNFFVLNLLHFLNDGIRTTFVALLPFVSKELKLNFTQVGFLGSSQGVLTSLFAFPTAYWAGKIGGYKLILISIFIYSVGAIGVGFSTSVLILMIAFYFSASGFGMFHVIGFSLISRLSDKTNIGKNLGNFTAIGDIGRVAIPPLVIFYVSFVGWRISYVIIGLVGIVFFGIIQVFSKIRLSYRHESSEKGKETHTEWVKQVAIILRQKKLFLILAAGIIDGLGGSPVYIFLPFLLLHKGVSIAMLSIFTGIYFAGSLLGKSVLGRGVDKFGNAKIFVLAEILMSFCLIFLVISTNLLLLLPIAFLLGIFTRGTTPVVTTLFSEVSHADHYEKVFAISELFLGITAALAPTFMGLVADKLGISFVFYTASLLAIIATIPILILITKKNALLHS